MLQSPAISAAKSTVASRRRPHRADRAQALSVACQPPAWRSNTQLLAESGEQTDAWSSCVALPSTTLTAWPGLEGTRLAVQPTQLAALMQPPSLLAVKAAVSAAAVAAAAAARPQCAQPATARPPDLMQQPPVASPATAVTTSQPSAAVASDAATSTGAMQQPQAYSPPNAAHANAQALTHRITACSGWHQVRALLAQQSPASINHVHVTAAMHHTSTLASQYSLSAAERQQLGSWLDRSLLPLALHLQSRMRPREMATVLHSLAVLEHAPSPVWLNAYCQQLSGQLYGFWVRDIASCSWALARLLALPQRQADGSTTSRPTWQETAIGLSGMETTMRTAGSLLQRSLLFFASANEQDIASLALAAASLYRQGLQLPPPQLPLAPGLFSTTHSYQQQAVDADSGDARTDQANTRHWRAWQEQFLLQVQRLLSRCGLQSLANVAHGMAQLPGADQVQFAWRNELQRVASPQLPSAIPQALSALLGSLGALGYSLGGSWALQLLGAVRQVLPDCNLEDLCVIGLHAPGIMRPLGPQGGPDVSANAASPAVQQAAEVLQQELQQQQQHTSDNAAGAAWRGSCEGGAVEASGEVLSGQDVTSWWHAYEDALMHRLNSSASPRQLSLLLVSLALGRKRLGMSPSRSTLAHWFATATPQLPHFSALDVSQCLAACMALGVGPSPEFMQQSMASVRRGMRTAPVSHVASALWWCAGLRFDPGWQFMLDLYSRTSHSHTLLHHPHTPSNPVTHRQQQFQQPNNGWRRSLAAGVPETERAAANGHSPYQLPGAVNGLGRGRQANDLLAVAAAACEGDLNQAVVNEAGLVEPAQAGSKHSRSAQVPDGLLNGARLPAVIHKGPSWVPVAPRRVLSPSRAGAQASPRLELQDAAHLLGGLARLKQRPLAGWVDWLSGVLPDTIDRAVAKLQQPAVSGAGQRQQAGVATGVVSVLWALYRLHIVPDAGLAERLGRAVAAALPLLPPGRAFLLLWAVVRVARSVAGTGLGPRSARRRSRLLGARSTLLPRKAKAWVLRNSTGVTTRPTVRARAQRYRLGSSRRSMGLKWRSWRLAHGASDSTEVAANSQGTATPRTQVVRNGTGVTTGPTVLSDGGRDVVAGQPADCSSDSMMAKLPELSLGVLCQTVPQLSQLDSRNLHVALVAVAQAMQNVPVSTPSLAMYLSNWLCAWLVAHRKCLMAAASSNGLQPVPSDSPDQPPAAAAASTAVAGGRLMGGQDGKARPAATRSNQQPADQCHHWHPSLLISLSKLVQLVTSSAPADLSPAIMGVASSSQSSQTKLQYALEDWLEMACSSGVPPAPAATLQVVPAAQIPSFVLLAVACGCSRSVLPVLADSLSLVRRALTQKRERRLPAAVAVRIKKGARGAKAAKAKLQVVMPWGVRLAAVDTRPVTLLQLAAALQQLLSDMQQQPASSLQRQRQRGSSMQRPAPEADRGDKAAQMAAMRRHAAWLARELVQLRCEGRLIVFHQVRARKLAAVLKSTSWPLH